MKRHHSSNPGAPALMEHQRLGRPKAEKHYKNFVAGKWTEARSGKTFDNLNPANLRELIATFPLSGPEDVDQAVESARAALPGWKATPAPRRGELLFKVGRILERRKEELARAMTREMGKILKETRGDVQEAIDMAYYCAGEGRRLFGQTTPSELPNKFCMSIRMPLGVCGLITPWNFPMAIPAWKIFPALICGNTVVFKPASDTPWSATLLVEALEEAGLPAGVVNLVHGNGETTGSAIVRHDGIDLISFTGSAETGREIAEQCGSDLKRFSLEMGGKNAQIVMDDADVDLAAEAAVWGAFGTTGQRCTATSRVILHRSILEEFTEKFLDRVKKIRIGNGLDPSTQMGPLINSRQREKVRKYVEIGKQEGAKLLLGGRAYDKGDCKDGSFFEPTVFANVNSKMRIAQDEIFGPVVCLMPARDFEQAVEIHNSTRYGLSSSIYTRDVNKAFRAIRELEAGITYVNGPTIGAEVHLPFGGVKDSGHGHREAGQTALDIFSEWKSVFVDYSGKIQRAQIDRD